MHGYMLMHIYYIIYYPWSGGRRRARAKPELTPTIDCLLMSNTTIDCIVILNIVAGSVKAKI